MPATTNHFLLIWADNQPENRLNGIITTEGNVITIFTVVSDVPGKASFMELKAGDTAEAAMMVSIDTDKMASTKRLSDFCISGTLCSAF